MTAEPNSPAVSSARGNAIRVLVVDDSAFMRYSITKHLNRERELQVVGAARNGLEALELIPALQPDVITLDVEMPRLDGLAALRRIMAECPHPVVMLSSRTQEGALETIQALALGAVDFVPKPDNQASISTVMEELVVKIKRAVHARVWQLPQAQVPAAPPPGAQAKITRPFTSRDRLVIIGCSTGGPRALNTIIPQLSPTLPAAYLIVQHMPAGFTRSLAERLDHLSPIKVKEAEPGERLEAGKALVAPGGFHMQVDANGAIELNQNPPVRGVRPAIDVTLVSAFQRYGKGVMGVILTGMGSDGTHGAALIHGAGGYVIVEDESTCVVWGMPRSVTETGAADAVVPLPGIAACIEKRLLHDLQPGQGSDHNAGVDQKDSTGFNPWTAKSTAGLNLR